MLLSDPGFRLLLVLFFAYILFNECRLRRERKYRIVEGFEGSLADSEAWVNLISVVKQLNNGGDFVFPGNLIVNGDIKTKQRMMVGVNEDQEGGWAMHKTANGGLDIGKNGGEVILSLPNDGNGAPIFRATGLAYLNKANAPDKNRLNWYNNIRNRMAKELEKHKDYISRAGVVYLGGTNDAGFGAKPHYINVVGEEGNGSGKIFNIGVHGAAWLTDRCDDRSDTECYQEDNTNILL